MRRIGPIREGGRENMGMRKIIMGMRNMWGMTEIREKNNVRDNEEKRGSMRAGMRGIRKMLEMRTRDEADGNQRIIAMRGMSEILWIYSV